MKSHEDSIETKNKHFKYDMYNDPNNKSRIYNMEYRKKPAELVRKDLISAMKLPDHEVLNRNNYLLILDSWREEWEKGVQVPVNPEALPHSLIKLSDNNDPSTVNDNVEHSFTLPKNLITYKNCSMSNISSYELDLEDICWLQTIKESDLGLDLSQNFLEYVIDRLEQHCARNIKARQAGIQYDDHIVCDVCHSPDSEDGNEMVFCDLCNICLHQACYGIQEIPEGDWLCKPCKELGSNKKNALCTLCPNVGGALKPTTKANKWAHVSCVYWIPEAKFLDLELLEPVEIKSIPNWRWNLVCSLCNVKKGAPIICDEKNCRVSYHVTCAFKHKLKMKIRLTDDKSNNVKLKSYCMKHSRDAVQREGKNKEIDFFTPINENEDENHEKTNSQCEFWKFVDIHQVSQEVADKYFDDNGENHNFSIVKNFTVNQLSLNQIIDLIYQYWKLKRLSNYGNSLIKMTFAEKFQEQMRLHRNQILSVRFNLERLRTLAYMICRREKIKHNWLHSQKEIIEATLKFAETTNCTKENDHQQTPLSDRLSNEHKKLFSRVISHHSIYAKETKNQNPIQDDCESTVQNKTIVRTTDELKTKRKLSDDSITNSLIREIKRLKKSQVSKNNPYAKVYLSTTKSRKSILMNGSSFEENQNSNQSSCIDEKSCKEISNRESLTNNCKKNLPTRHVNNVENNSKKLLRSNVENSKIKGNGYLTFNEINEIKPNVKYSLCQKRMGIYEVIYIRK